MFDGHAWRARLNKMLGLVVVLLALTCEAVLLAFWVPSYYRIGPKVFREKLSVAGPIDLHELEKACEGNLFASPLAFKALSPDEVAFQEKGWPMRVWTPYVPVIRGLIVKGRVSGQDEIVGILLWYPVVAVVIAFLSGVAEGLWSGFAPAAAIALAVTLMSAAQWKRFAEVRKTLSGKPEGRAQ